MLTKTLKRVKIKGRTDAVVRELYLRSDIPCHSPVCLTCLHEKASKTMKLEKDIDHYAVPCADILQKYLEIFECQEVKGIIILQSVLTKISQSCGHRFSNRILNICKDIRRGSVIFLNEICDKSHAPRLFTESLDEWLIKCLIKSAEFYAEHLKGSIPIILITDNLEVYKSKLKNESVSVYSLKQYLEDKWKDLDSVHQLYESITLSLSDGTVNDLSKSYDSYLPNDVLLAGIKAGRFFRGYLQVNKHNASQEAFVGSTKIYTKDSGDIFIHGSIDRNRAVHGDEVVVELHPEHQWKSRCHRLIDDPCGKGDNVDNADNMTSVMPTGKVVGILERCWRNYVATLPEEDEEGNATRKERILVVPYDYRIPKIRITTKQADKIRNKRIVVRIDSWEKDSQYPNGHLVQTLGDIGNLDTEVQSLLIEHCISVGEFSQNLMQDLPICSEENPWQLEEAEVSKRKDLRTSHLIFSIDPKGCEDVDDTLSVRELPNGHLELGVHIADVTYFVQPLSSVDLEAKCRSTSVYLPDRRYDMLPHILSGNLCSLLGNVDRYAVSILWELDSRYSVQNIWYGRTVVKSSYKLSYEVAQEILNNATVEDIISEVPELQGLDKKLMNDRFLELKNAICKLYHVANVLRKERLNAGGLELNSIDMKFEIDKMLPYAVSDIKPAKDLAVHKTVAECMIFANHWVAKKINDAFPQLSLLRKHPSPRESDLKELQKLALLKGFSLNIQSNKEFAMSLEKAIDKNDSTVNQVIRIMATQSMNVATYFCTGYCNPDEFFHYGLGLDKYTHFTSPIRRYADVMVHRMLLASTSELKSGIEIEMAEIEELCHHLNAKHKAAQDLEKDAKQLYLAYFIDEMASKENQSCIVDGIIYSLMANGMLVFIPKYGIKGAVQLCNKEKKVAIVEDSVKWVDGSLDISDSSILVKSCSIIQKYNIFDHITLCMKTLKYRSHQHKIVFDLIKNAPYISDLQEVQSSESENASVTDSVSTDDVEDKECEVESMENFNLYLFLQKIKMLCISDVEN